MPGQKAADRAAPFRDVIDLQVDHATICGRSLPLLQRMFTDIGMRPDYGGAHPGSDTHMAMLGFEDGSYLELIAPLDPAAPRNPKMRWSTLITADAGPCAWATRANDIEREAQRLTVLGVPVTRRTLGSRMKPDGTSVEWVRADVGPGDSGSVLPFLIQDRTPRSFRVQPTESIKHSGLFGVSRVVIGVTDLESRGKLFCKAYGWPPPFMFDDNEFDARLAYFAKTPVVLAGSLNSPSWLADRLTGIGESPVAFLLGAHDFDKAFKSFCYSRPARWFEQEIGWIDPMRLGGIRLGIVGS
jgi:hypothetical protein